MARHPAGYVQKPGVCTGTDPNNPTLGEPMSCMALCNGSRRSSFHHSKPIVTRPKVENNEKKETNHITLSSSLGLTEISIN